MGGRPPFCKQAEMARAQALLIAAFLAAPAACGSGGAPSSQEKRDLDEAEHMLNEAPNSLAGIDETMLIEANQPETGEPERGPGTDDR